MSIVQQSIVLITLSLALNIAWIIVIARRGDDGFRIRLLILLNYLVDNVLSGVVHIFRLSSDRGFYEALAGNPPGDGTGLLTASWAALIGVVALGVGVLYRRPARQRSTGESLWSAASSHRLAVMVLGLGMLAVCGASWLKVRSVTAGVDGRIIAVAGGNARYVTLAGWLQWAVTLLALVLISRRGTSLSHTKNAIIMLLAVSLIVVTQAWSGGRSTLLFSCLPLLAVVLPHTGKAKWPMLGFGGVGLGAIIWYLTLKRAEESAGSTDLWGLVDWQWGRFSMGAWAARYVEEHGSVAGETFLSSLLALPDALLHFVGVALPFEGIRSMVEITGESFRGSSELIYIVPGLTAELILNFGLIGVALGYLALGRLAGWLADLFRDAQFEMQRVLIVFVATVVAFSTIVSAAEAFFLTLFMDGMPLFVIAALERWLGKRSVAADRPAVRG